MSILGMWWEYRGHHGQPCLGCGLTMKGFRSDDLLCVNPFALDLSPLRKFINDEIDRAHLREIDEYLAKMETDRRAFFEGAQWDDAESRQQAFYGALPPKSEVVVSSERFIWLTSDGLYSSDGSTVSRMGIPPGPSPLDKALEDFVARRKAKRGICKCDRPECARNGCRHIPYAETAALVETRKAQDAAAEVFDRAMSLPLSFTARMGMRY